MADSGTVDSTEALGALASEMLGDYSSDPVPESAEAPDAGTPPTPESPASSDGATPPVEGAEPVEPQDTPPADAPATATPDEPQAPVDPETGFDAEPAMTYTVDGVAKAYDGIRVVDGAGYIKPSALADVQRKLGERDHLFEANQRLYQESKTFNAALVYKIGEGEKAREWRGVEAFRQASSDAASNSACGQFLIQQFQRLFPNPTKEQAEGLKDIFDRAQLIMDNAALKTAQTFGTAVLARTAEAERPSVDGAFENAVGAIERWATENKKALTKEDFAELREIYSDTKGGLVRRATPQERQQYKSDTVFDQSPMNRWVEKRIAQNEARAKTNTVVDRATQQNANRLATVVQPRRRAPVPPTVPKNDTERRKQDADAAWDLQERLAFGRMAKA